MVDLVRELGAFMLKRKKFWLLPIVGILGIFGGLIVLTEGSAICAIRLLALVAEPDRLPLIGVVRPFQGGPGRSGDSSAGNEWPGQVS